MKNRKKIQNTLLVLSLTLMVVMLVFNSDTGWKYWIGPLSMACVAISQVVGRRKNSSSQR